MEHLGENIRYFRLKSDWTQQQLADRINMSRSVLTRWENGQLIPDLPALLKLSEIFDISLDTLTGNPQNKEMLLREAREIYQLNPRLDEQILEIIRYLQHHQELKTGLYRLARASRNKRKPYEKMLTVLLHDMLSE